MNKIKLKLIPLFLLFINALIISMVMQSGYYMANFKFSALLPFQILPLLLVLGIIGVFQGQGKGYKIGFLFLFLISGFLIYRLVLATDFMTMPDDIRQINTIIQNDELIQFVYFETTLKFIMLVTTTVLAATLYIFPYNMVILDGGLIIFLWVMDYNRNSYEYLRYFLPMWTFGIFLDRAGVRDGQDKNLKVNYKKRILNALAFSLIIIITSFFVNIETEGIYSERLRAYFTGESLVDGSLTARTLADAFNLRQTGYNNSNTKLGGNITIDEEEILRAVGDRLIYLRGNVKTTYTGNQWVWQDRSFLEQTFIDNTKMNRLESINGEKALKEVEIRPTKQITSSMFHSLYTREVVFKNNIAKVFYDEMFDTFTGNKTVVNDYKVTYYDESLLGFIEENSAPALGLDVEQYLALPETISQRTIDLVESLVTDEMTDRQKAVVLTRYLKENYVYTLTPGNLPEGEDFVDYFLFENEEGYCVYFGTALSVMLRISGVPTRYVEGFKMGNELIDGAYIVRNSDAHAWTEVLVDQGNEIWETFDATGTPREMIFGEEPLDETPVDEPQTPVEEQEKPETVVNQEENNPLDEANALKIPAYILAMLALVGLLGLRILYKKSRREKSYHEKSLKPYFNELNKTLDVIYYHKAPEETFLEFAKKIKEEDLRKKYETLVQEVYKEEYGGEKGEYPLRQELQDDVYDIMKEYRGVVYSALKKYVL